MNKVSLPTAQQLAKLPLRALAAYAAKCARRGTASLRGVLDDELIELPLRLAEEFATRRELDHSDGIAAPLAASRVAAFMGLLKSPHQRIAALCLSHGVSELWSADRDFSRFATLKVSNPLVA